MESLLFPLLLALLAGFMFMSIRKQKKRMTEMQDMQNSVTTGSRVQLTSGLYGTVIDASPSDVVDVEIASGIVTRWNRQAIMSVIPTEDAAATYPGAVTGTEADESDDDSSFDEVDGAHDAEDDATTNRTDGVSGDNPRDTDK